MIDIRSHRVDNRARFVGTISCNRFALARIFRIYQEISPRPLHDLPRDQGDLIVSMEQAEISPRPVVGAIVVVSGVAVSFLLWLLYVHHASADFAGRWMFLPALNALLNGLCAIALCVGLYFIKHHNREAHRTSMLLAFAFSSVFLISYIVNHTLHGDTIFPGHGPVRTLYLSIPFHFSQPRNPFRRRAADGAHDVLFLADGPVCDAPPNRALDVPCLAVRFDYGRGGFRLPQGVCILDLRIDPA